jgi:predicted nicotinamide N-methyase
LFSIVFDLPQIYTKPSAKELIHALSLLSIQPQSWDHKDNGPKLAVERQQITPEGVPKYLTSIVSNELRWIKDEAEREEIWDQASLRLAERSGRTGMPAMSRNFTIPTQTGHVEMSLHEPSLTEDHLGFKTWASSYMLAKRLCGMDLPKPKEGPQRILELGSGTGLVGMAAAAVLKADVLLTDLPEIEGNLARNVAQNLDMIESEGGSATTAVLDWTNPKLVVRSSSVGTDDLAFLEPFPIILAADAIYSAEHPAMLVNAITLWLEHSPKARLILELPLREGYEKEREDLRQRLFSLGLEVLEQGEEVGYDDWCGVGSELQEVPCWWSIWRWRAVA